MTTKLSVLLILLSFNTELPKLVAQNTQNSTLVNSLSSIIYTDNTGKDTVGVQVGGIWWAPVNVKISGNNDADSSFFSYPEADPCPYGWRLPTLEEIKKLERVVKSGKGEFDYDSKNFKIKSDDGKSQLLIPANGVMSTLENPVSVAPSCQSKLTPCTKICLTLFAKIKMSPVGI